MKKKWTNDDIQFLIDNYQTTSSKDLASIMERDHTSTKRAIKKYIFDKQDNTLPEGYVVISQSPIHAVNNKGIVIRIRTRKVIKPSVNRKGYLQVCLQNKRSHRIHRLVAENFLSNPDDKPQVNHKDGNKLNNYLSNLEWVTDAENRSHAISTGLWDSISQKISDRQIGSGNSRSKLVDSDVLSIYKMLKDGTLISEIAKKFNVNRSNIYAIKKGRSWQHLYSYYSEGSTTRA